MHKHCPMECVEAIRASLSSVSLCQLPTPVERLSVISSRLGVDVWIKRDDRISDVYGGNHVRKLELLFADAMQQGAKRLIAFGGVGSNYVCAVAAHCRRVGLPCEAVLIHQPLTAQVRRNLLLAKAFGANMHYARTFPGAGLKCLQLATRFLLRDGRTPHVVRPGGSTPLGAAGFALAGLELANQVHTGACPRPDVLFVTVSSCGTIAGLRAGMALGGLTVPIQGIRVVESVIANPSHIRMLTGKVLRLVRRSVPHLPVPGPDVVPPFELRHDYFRACYGAPTQKAEMAVDIAREQEGLELEGTYTGKTFAALLDWGADPANRRRRALFWNTYSSTDVQAHLAAVDWRSLPKRTWRYFDGTLALEDERFRMQSSRPAAVST